MFLGLVVFGVLSFLFKFIIRPYIQLQFYKKQGAITMFHWEIIPYIKNYRNTFTKGDFYYIYKQAIKKNPKARFIVENFGSRVSIIMVDPAMAKDTLMKHDIYEKDWTNLEHFQELCGETLTARGKTWRKIRRAVGTALNFELFKEMVPTLVATVQDKFSEWATEGKITNMDLVERMGDLTGEMTGKVIFGKNFSDRKVHGVTINTAIQRVFKTMIIEMFSPSLLTIIFGAKLQKTNILPRHRELNKTIQEIRKQCKIMIDESENSGKKENNLLGYMLSMRQNEKEEDRITDNEILSQFVSLFVAGTETSSHLISSAIYFVWKHPEAYKKVKEEVDRVFGDLNSLTLENINTMEYTTALLKETLRLGGPTGMLPPKLAGKDDNVCGIEVKQGTLVNYYNQLFFLSDKYFDNHKEFLPERWFVKEYKDRDGHKDEPFSYLPFSAGPRNCIGQHFAYLKVKIILALLIKNYDFQFPEGYEMKLTQKTTYEPIDPLLLSLKPKTK